MACDGDAEHVLAPRVEGVVTLRDERHIGFAFGMGLQRVVMLRYGIDDVRHLPPLREQLAERLERLGRRAFHQMHVRGWPFLRHWFSVA